MSEEKVLVEVSARHIHLTDADVDSVCVNVHPTLTSFDNELETMGRRAARHLLDAINGRPHHGVFQVESRLVIRESTDATRHDPLHGSGWRAGLE